MVLLLIGKRLIVFRVVVRLFRVKLKPKIRIVCLKSRLSCIRGAWFLACIRGSPGKKDVVSEPNELHQQGVERTVHLHV